MLVPEAQLRDTRRANDLLKRAPLLPCDKPQSRRALRLWVEDLRWEAVKVDAGETAGKPPACVRVYFVLPKGSYATTVLGTALALDEVRSAGGTPVTDEEETDGAIAT